MTDRIEPRKAWDDGLKALVYENPDAFIHWLLGDSIELSDMTPEDLLEIGQTISRESR